MLNPFQRIVTQTYGGGDYKHIQNASEARNVGDTLFTFLMVELSSVEDCDTKEEALRRIEQATHQLDEVFQAIDRAD